MYCKSLWIKAPAKCIHVNVFRDDVIQIHTFLMHHAVYTCTYSVAAHSHISILGLPPLSPAPAWRSPCRNSRQRLTGHSTGCISLSWLLSSSLRLFHPWSPLEAPGHVPIPLCSPVHKPLPQLISAIAVPPEPVSSQICTGFLSLPLNVSFSLSLPLWLSIYLSCSVPLPLTLALAMLPSAGRDYLIALGWKQWVGGGTEGEREGCRKREMLAGTETPPTPSSRAPNNAGGRETESKRYVAHAFSTYSKEFPLLFPFERLQKKSTRGGNQGKSGYRHSPTCTYTLPHPSSHTSRENG